MSYYFKAFDKVEIPRPIQQRSRRPEKPKIMPKAIPRMRVLPHRAVPRLWRDRLREQLQQMGITLIDRPRCSVCSVNE